MYEKFELSENEIEKYGFKNSLYSKAIIRNEELSLILVELCVHYSELPDRSFSLLIRDEKIYIHSRVESYDPLVIRLNSQVNGIDKHEYEYAKIIRDSVAAYNSIHQRNDAWYSVSITNAAKQELILKSEIHSLDNIITSLCLHGRQRSLSFTDLSKKLISSISRHGYGRADLEKFIESGEYKSKLRYEGKEFIKFWIKEGKDIKGQYAAIESPLTVFNFFEINNQNNLDGT